MQNLKELMRLEKGEARERGLEYTPREIWRQSEYWIDTLDRVLAEREGLRSILNGRNAGGSGGRVILSGAGSSDFVARSARSLLQRRLGGWWVQALPTTSIVTHPRAAFDGSGPQVLISLARSGNSPESEAAFELAEKYGDRPAHIVITCNREGRLAEMAGESARAVSVLLHPDTNDRGLAMTASFTNMLVALQALAHLEDPESYRSLLSGLRQLARGLLAREDVVREIAGLDFERAVFLGSGALTGVARESALKLQELTDGRVMCTYDTFLGFRHGPESVVDERTLSVFYLSGDDYVRRYETDLIEGMAEKGLGHSSVAVGQGLSDLEGLSDWRIDPGADGDFQPPDDLVGPVWVIFGQLLGLFRSLELGLKPDNPSRRGAIHRVVRGVKIYKL